MSSDRYDKEYTQRFYEEDMRHLIDDYFRVEVRNEQHAPLGDLGERPIIFIANHSAMGMSWDNIVFDAVMYRLLEEYHQSSENALDRKPRRLIDPLLIGGKQSLNLFSIKDWWEKIGCLPASLKSYEYLLERKIPVFVSPEGTDASSKSFTKRYRLQPFSTSFILMAMKYDAEVVPVTITNAEYTRPFNFRIDVLHRFVRRYLGMPLFPIGPAVTQVLFPATYLTPYPVKLIYEFQQPVRFQGDAETVTRDELKRMAEEFRQKFQLVVDDSVRKYHRPYDLVSFLKRFVESPNRRLMIPFFWHGKFLKTAGYPSWMALAYKVPFGFPLVKLAHVWFERKRIQERDKLRGSR
jgi:1-acyl-sn-glycerol-3-phosphate acyltransferase